MTPTIPSHLLTPLSITYLLQHSYLIVGGFDSDLTLPLPVGARDWRYAMSFSFSLAHSILQASLLLTTLLSTGPNLHGLHDQQPCNLRSTIFSVFSCRTSIVSLYWRKSDLVESYRASLLFSKAHLEITYIIFPTFPLGSVKYIGT